jgi:SAM-dependent methyltransferase
VTEPARWGLRRTLLDLFHRLHLARPVVRTYELALAGRARLSSRRTAVADGVPLPPARLRAQVGPSHAAADVFLQSGRRHAALIREFLREDAKEVEELEAILDWGCGCGRVLRHWSQLPHTRVCGCDINPKMVEWCATHLDFAEVTVTGISPPLPYADSSFDLLYALSVFTHLPEKLQHAWMRECFRVLKPEGHLLISTMGDYYLSLNRLTERERQTFLGGDVVVLYEDSAGTSLCSAYHPPEYVRTRLAADFDLVSFQPAAVDGRHDMHLFRKPVASGAAAGQSAQAQLS